MSKSSRGFGLIPILLILLLICGAIGGFLIVKNKNQGSSTAEIRIPKTATHRQSGRTKHTADGTIDTPVYDDTISGATIGQKGGVIPIQLKSGARAYLIIPPNTCTQQYIEISEFKKLPTSSAHLPLSTDLGFGLNIAFTGYTGDLQNQPAFLVWDFSSGEQLKTFQALAKKNNHCDYSKATFQPEICATLLNLPVEQTLNKKYFAAEPKYSDDGNFPTFAAYSYFLSDRLLINRITDSTVIVPQSAALDLIQEIIKINFDGRYSDTYNKEEAKDLIRNFGLSNFNVDVLQQFDMNPFFHDFKSLECGIYIANLIQSKMKEMKEQDAFNLNQLLDSLQKYNKERPQALLSYWSQIATLNPSDYDSVVAAANLRRAYDAKMNGTDKVVNQTLEKEMNNISANDSFDESTFYAFETMVTLLGKNKYAKPGKTSATLSTTFIAEARAEDNPDSQDKMYQQLIGQAERELALILNNSDNISLPDFLHALAIAQLLDLSDEEKKLTDLIQNMVRKEMKNATEDDEKIEADKHCHLLLDDSECGNLDNEVQKIFVKTCHGKVVTKNLHNFGNQTLEMGDLENCTTSPTPTSGGGSGNGGDGNSNSGGPQPKSTSENSTSPSSPSSPSSSPQSGSSSSPATSPTNTSPGH